MRLSVFIYFGIFSCFVSTASADAQIAVSENDLNCIIENKNAYRSQGDIITLNFLTCPEPPSFREVLRAREAENVFPRPTPREENATDAPVTAVAVTKSQFDCLIESIGSLEVDDATGLLMILPEICGSLSE